MTRLGGGRRRRGARPRRRRRHPLPADPDALPGRPRQHLPHRRRPADARRQRPELGHGAGRARARARRARAPRRGPRADRHLPPAHRPPRARRRSSRAARAREVAALDLLAPWVEHWSEAMDADDAFAERIMAEHGIPEDVRHALIGVSQSYRGWGAAATVTRPLADGSRAAPARPHAARPAPSRPLAVGHDLPRRGSAASCSAPTTSSSTSPPTRSSRARSRRQRRAADGGGGGGETAERPHALEIYIDSLRATRAMDGRRPRARRPRRAGDRPRRAHRRALPAARAARGEDPPPHRRGSRARPTRSRSRCGATSRSRRPT